jgi:anti-sigma regulatory factor (Ser/Thr protein kinase)
VRTARPRARAAGGRTGEHDALLYRSHDEYVDGVLAFLQPGMLAGEPMFVAVPGANGESIRSALPESGRRVVFADMTAVGQNPARIVPAITAFVDAHEGQRVRFVGEPIWPGRSAEEICEATRHEAMLNTVFGQTDVDILCPYDVTGLDEATIENAWRTHPTIIDRRGCQASAHYADPKTIYDAADPLLPPVPESATVTPIRATELPTVREVVRAFATDAGLPAERVRDLVLATNEVATNSVMYADGDASLRVWREPRSVICEIRDRGHVADFLAGRRRPTGDGARGRGLWMANHLCDLVQLRSTTAGTIVRLHVHHLTG